MPQMLRRAAGSDPGAFRLFYRKRLTIRKNVYILNLSNRYGKGLGAMKVYISYPHRRRSFAADIAGVLRKNGYEVSWDHDLAGGSNWAGELAREIASGLN